MAGKLAALSGHCFHWKACKNGQKKLARMAKRLSNWRRAFSGVHFRFCTERSRKIRARQVNKWCQKMIVRAANEQPPIGARGVRVPIRCCTVTPNWRKRQIWATKRRVQWSLTNGRSVAAPLLVAFWRAATSSHKRECALSSPSAREREMVAPKDRPLGQIQ